MKTTLKTIDVNAKEWFDKVNGNSYYAGELVVNYGMEDEKKFLMPFDYGYGDSYKYTAKEILIKEGIIPEEFKEKPLWQLRDDLGIKINANIQTGCKKRDLMQYK